MAHIGIDIGTSYSSVCILNENGQPERVKIATGTSVFGDSYSLPSAVFLEQDGRLLLGQAAFASRMRAPQNFKAEFKRDLGQQAPYLLGGKSYLPEDLYKEFFIHIKKCVDEYMHESVTSATVTFPAMFNENKKKLVEKAAKAAGLLDVKLIDEPSAAAYCYLSAGKLSDGDTLMVYDLGGGTFDLALMRVKNGQFVQLTQPMGNPRLGGSDFDRIIFDDIMAQIGEEKIAPVKANLIHFSRFVAATMELAVKAKHHLSSSDVFSDYITVGLDGIDYTLEGSRYNAMIAPVIDDTMKQVQAILQTAGLKPSEVNKVLLVGGASRTPLVREMLTKELGQEPFKDVDPELAVCEGAVAIFAFQKRLEEQRRKEQENQERNLNECEVELLAANGNTRLSDDDINQKVMDYIVSEFKKSNGIDLSEDKMAMIRIKEAVKKAKIELLSVMQANINLPFITSDASSPKHLDMTLTREKFKELTSATQVIGVDKSDPDNHTILLNAKGRVGGSGVSVSLDKFLQVWGGSESASQRAYARQHKTISANDYHTVGLKSDGTVVATGKNDDGQCDVNDWRDIISVDTGIFHTVGLKSDGTVVTTGDDDEVCFWKDIVLVVAGDYHTFGLNSDGTVLATSEDIDDECNVSNWSDIIALSTKDLHTVGLKSDGTVVATGDNSEGQCNVSNWRNIVSVKVNDYHTVGLKSDGTVVAVGQNNRGQCDVSGWRDIVSIQAEAFSTIGLKADGTVVSTNKNDIIKMKKWNNIISITADDWNCAGLKSDGTVVAVGENDHGQCHVSGWRDIVSVTAGLCYFVGLKADGTVVATGTNDEGQCNVSSWRNIRIPQ